jgi:hypothetical protein
VGGVRPAGNTYPFDGLAERPSSCMKGERWGRERMDFAIRRFRVLVAFMSSYTAPDPLERCANSGTCPLGIASSAPAAFVAGYER